ncbi:unnamed protein product [Leuciscus chuanchicus]
MQEIGLDLAESPESPRESSSASRAECRCGCFMTRARQLQVSINNRAHHDQGMRRNTKRFLFIQLKSFLKQSEMDDHIQMGTSDAISDNNTGQIIILLPQDLKSPDLLSGGSQHRRRPRHCETLAFPHCTSCQEKSICRYSFLLGKGPLEDLRNVPLQFLICNISDILRFRGMCFNFAQRKLKQRREERLREQCLRALEMEPLDCTGGGYPPREPPQFCLPLQMMSPQLPVTHTLPQANWTVSEADTDVFGKPPCYEEAVLMEDPPPPYSEVLSDPRGGTYTKPTTRSSREHQESETSKMAPVTVFPERGYSSLIRLPSARRWDSLGHLLSTMDLNHNNLPVEPQASAITTMPREGRTHTDLGLRGLRSLDQHYGLPTAFPLLGRSTANRLNQLCSGVNLQIHHTRFSLLSSLLSVASSADAEQQLLCERCCHGSQELSVAHQHLAPHVLSHLRLTDIIQMTFQTLTL